MDVILGRWVRGELLREKKGPQLRKPPCPVWSGSDLPFHTCIGTALPPTPAQVEGKAACVLDSAGCWQPVGALSFAITALKTSGQREGFQAQLKDRASGASALASRK